MREGRHLARNEGLVLDPGDGAVSKTDVSALLALTFQGRVSRWREKEGGRFTLRDREQERGEGRAIGMEGVNEREGEGCRGRKT